jgi:hypothetical protein
MQTTMLSNPGPVGILSSLIGYGLYLPAQIINKRLQKAGIPSQLYLVETLFTEDKKKTFQASRHAFGKNFRLAQLAARVPVDYHSSISEAEAERIYESWRAGNVTEFLCFSGLWLELLNGYVPSSGSKRIRCCRIDAGEAQTWANLTNVGIGRTYYFSNLPDKKINYTLSIAELQSVSYESRRNEVVVHGGGWGLGNYIQKTAALKQAGYFRKIILNPIADLKQEQEEQTAFFINDPSWDPLLNATDEGFPPLGAVVSDGIEYSYCTEHHPALCLINESKAVISKPGGMTLIDAIITETPFIYLEAMGTNEEGNTVLIDHYGLGMPYEKWKESGFSPKLLEECHRNIRKLKNGLPDFVDSYVRDLEADG